MKIKNVAIVAHVDHGKTTLVDQLLKASNSLDRKMGDVKCILDSNALEKERGITILAKNTTVYWQDYVINIVDTPGHADFGGEVERILSMVDAVILLVDAKEGPMPQTRFVTQKAFAKGLPAICVVNKIDRDGSRPDFTVDAVFDLFDNLGATDEQLDFPVIYASGMEGYAGNNLDELLNTPKEQRTMDALFEAIIEHVPEPNCKLDAPFQMQISTLDYSEYVGTIGIGVIKQGSVKLNDQVSVVNANNPKEIRKGKVQQIIAYRGLDQFSKDSAQAGEIIGLVGISPLSISDTVCAVDAPNALPALHVDAPTLSMIFQVNNSPFAGQEGKFLTSRHLRDRLYKETIHNVALKVSDTEDPEKFLVCGRGELHLGILIETMRREGYEFAVSRPKVIIKEEDGKKQEPYEALTIDCDISHQGPIMEYLGPLGADLKSMEPDNSGSRVRLDYIVPARALIGFHPKFQTMTQGTGIATTAFDHYGDFKQSMNNQRRQGVLIASVNGVATAYALWNLQARGKLMVVPKQKIYEGMIVGLNSRDNDLVVNVTKEKQLTNVRASGTDENIVLTPVQDLVLEQALSFIDDDELIEITPNAIRLRKIYLKEHERKRVSRSQD